MSRENVEIVQRLFEAAGRRDTGALALYDPDVEWDASRISRGVIVGRVVRGRDALRGWLHDWYEMWESLDDNLEELIEANQDTVVSVMVQRGRARTSGVEVESRLGTVWTIRRGKIVRVVWFPSREHALEAVGLSESAVSQENVEVVRRMWRAWDRRDMQAVFALYDSAIVWENRSGPIELRRVSHGHDGVRQVFREWMEPFDSLRAEAETFIDAGDQVVVGWRQWGRGKTSGVDVDVSAWQVCTIRDGLVTRVVLFETKTEALEAAGLSE